MKKTSATHTKFTSLLILATLLVAPIASPTVADAQLRRNIGGVEIKNPTASITVNGSQNTTVQVGSKAPVVRWVSKNGTTHKTTLKVNNASLCGVKNGQVWGSGKNAQGTANALAPTAARAGCVLTFVYEVANQIGQKASDTAVVRYVAAKPAPTKPKPTIINPNTGGSGTSTSTTATPTTYKLKLLTPNGGERWMINSDNTIITWEPEPHADGMVAYLEQKQGNKFVTVGKIVEARKGSIQWLGEIEKNGKIQNATPGRAYYIRLVNTRTGESDRSDAPFTIVASNAFDVNLQPADVNNYLRVNEAGNVRLTWDARSPAGVRPNAQNISCTLTVFDKYGNQVTNMSVEQKGSYEIYAELPNPTQNDQNSYTLANVSCNSSLGTRGDYIELISDNVATTPTLEIEMLGDSTIFTERNIPFSFSGQDIRIPSNVRVELYSPITGNQGSGVVYGNIGESTFTRTSEKGTLIAPSTPGQYRLTVCDDNTPNPEVTFKPLCAHSEYFNVVYDTSSTTPKILVTGVAESAIIDVAEFSGDIEKGIYEITVDIQAGNKDIFIPDFRDIPGFTYSITDIGIPFTGSTTAYISQATAPYLWGTNTGSRYQIAENTSETFTFRVELDPVGMSTNQPYGIKLLELNFGHSTSTIDRIYTFPDTSEFETSKVTIANALPTGVIERTVAQGETGEQVTLVQIALKKAGLFNEEITGYFGSITRAAVKAFQREHALENVGAVGPRTMSLMNQILGN